MVGKVGPAGSQTDEGLTPAGTGRPPADDC